MEKGVFGSLFDLNRDGKLDTWEQNEELIFLYDVFMGVPEGIKKENGFHLDEFDEGDSDDADIDFDDLD